MIKVAVLILTCILVGFAVGRRLGLKEGFQVGMAYGVLDMRQQCLKSGRCPVCNSVIPITDSMSPQDDLGVDILRPTDNLPSDVSRTEFDAWWLQDVIT